MSSLASQCHRNHDLRFSSFSNLNIYQVDRRNYFFHIQRLALGLSKTFLEVCLFWCSVVVDANRHTGMLIIDFLSPKAGPWSYITLWFFRHAGCSPLRFSPLPLIHSYWILRHFEPHKYSKHGFPPIAFSPPSFPQRCGYSQFKSPSNIHEGRPWQLHILRQYVGAI